MPFAARAGTASAATITVRYHRRGQTIEGFGTCINTWQHDVAQFYQSADFLRFYKERLGATALRIELYPGSAALERDRWQDISHRDFVFDGAGARGELTNSFAARLGRLFAGDLRVIATAWSPPAWMKVNGSTGNGHPDRKNFALDLGNALEAGPWPGAAPGAIGAERYRYIAMNKLRKDRYLHFAKLLVEWRRHFRSRGIDLYGLSPTNEPLFSHWFESCVYTPAEYAELLETIRWIFEKESEPALELFGPEHMTWDRRGNQLYLEALARRGTSVEVLTAVASHGYVDGYAVDLRRASPQALATVAERYNKKAWVTEGGFGAHNWPQPLHELAASLLYALRDGGVSLLTSWQSVTRQPDEHGLMSLLGATKKTYACMHFWRFIRPGMVRIESDVAGPIEAVAFERPDRMASVLVILNRRATAATVSLALAGRQFRGVRQAYITDATRNFEPMNETPMPTFLVPAESLVTLSFATG